MCYRHTLRFGSKGFAELLWICGSLIALQFGHRTW